MYLFQKILSSFPDYFVRFTSHDTGITIEFSPCRCQVVDEIKMVQWIPEKSNDQNSLAVRVGL